jgi:hypothetical protein
MAVGLIEKAFGALGLTVTQKLILIELCNRANPEGDGIFARQQLMADRCGCDRLTVNRTLKEFFEWGLVMEVDQRRSGIKEWAICLDFLAWLGCDDRSHPPVTTDHTGVTTDHTPCDDRSHPPINKELTVPLTVHKPGTKIDFRKKMTGIEQDDGTIRLVSG